MSALEKFRLGLAGSFEKEFLFCRAHPRAGAHLVCDDGKVLGIDAAALVPAPTLWVDLRGSCAVTFDDFKKARALGVAGDDGGGLLPFFRAGLEGFEETGGPTSIPAGAELVDRFVREVRGSSPVFLSEERESAAEKKSESKDHFQTWWER